MIPRETRGARRPVVRCAAGVWFTAIVLIACAPARLASGPGGPQAPAAASPTEPAAPSSAPSPDADRAPAPIEFETAVRPILGSRCRPCHFEGGQMYDRLPFDRPETIRALGERLFTRITDPGEQAAIRAFLAQATMGAATSP